jgi:hypothetical protein
LIVENYSYEKWWVKNRKKFSNIWIYSFDFFLKKYRSFPHQEEESEQDDLEKEDVEDKEDEEEKTILLKIKSESKESQGLEVSLNYYVISIFKIIYFKF